MSSARLGEFTLAPGVGLEPIHIGMTEQQLLALAGSPASRLEGRNGEQDLRFAENSVRVTVRDGMVVEASVCPPSAVLFEGEDLFSSPSVWKRLVDLDGGAQEADGFVILPRIGLAMTGFHDGDASQLAITAFEHGRWDVMAGSMRPFVD